MKLNLTDVEKETLSYHDVAYRILKLTNKKMKIQELFKEVLKEMDLPDSEYENGIVEFFELLVTDKRFIMLDSGYCDLKINHSTKIIIDDEDDELEVSANDDLDETDSDEESTDEESFDEDVVDDDPTDDDLDDLVIIDENEEQDGDIL